MTFQIWSNAGKFEWIIWVGDTILDRSGLIYNSHTGAYSNLKRRIKEM